MDALSPTARCIVVAAAAWVLLPAGTRGQATALVTASENLRREPRGDVVAQVLGGTRLPIVARREPWLQVDLEGWVWSRSLRAVNRTDFDLVVSEPGGENVRESPSGAIVARLSTGALLEEISRQSAWVRVRRRAWIWSPSVVESSATAVVASPAAAPPSGDDPPAARPGAFSVVGGSGATLLASPGGDTLARTVPGAEVEVLGREGSWVRVRLEGWTWLPAAAVAEPGVAPSAALTPADIGRDPDAHRGRVVSWQLQFISLERAERIRTDFLEGEPFILGRFGGPEGSFVYVAVPPDRVDEVQGLVPLERLAVTGRVRTGASVLTGTPIVDLIALERVR
jgi:hypothetical protein